MTEKPDIAKILEDAAKQPFDPMLQGDALVNRVMRAVSAPMRSPQFSSAEAQHVRQFSAARLQAMNEDPDIIQRDIRRAMYDDLVDWLAKPLVLTKTGIPMAPVLQRASKKEPFLLVYDGDGTPDPQLVMSQHTFEFQSLLIRHDWAAAFEGAQDFDGGTLRLPFPNSAFEFVISGRPVVVLAVQDPGDDSIVCMPATRSLKRWALFNAQMRLDRPINRDADSLWTFIHRQIRAACIVLDAEVAEVEAIREPYRGKVRGPGAPLPALSHHVINLSKKRVRSAPAEPSVDPVRRRRLHLRRGHWRHYATSKTWINWMLVGDPDLGFIEKEYRL